MIDIVSQVFFWLVVRRRKEKVKALARVQQGAAHGFVPRARIGVARARGTLVVTAAGWHVGGGGGEQACGTGG